MASWYERHILPHIIRYACGCSLTDEQRLEVVPKARGNVLELGLGAGANLRFYDPASVSRVTGIEPSPALRAMAAQAQRPSGLDVALHDASAESLPFSSASFDTVVCTFTLCSVHDPFRTLAEARRVLKPGGRFLFCEHGSAPDPGVRTWQRRIEPFWKPVFGGCHITRPVRGTIEQFFEMARWTGGYQKTGPRFAGWLERGEAIAKP